MREDLNGAPWELSRDLVPEEGVEPSRPVKVTGF
jgi:hypothetical protein